jgi:DNA-binding GntR family transcriptional regulator
LNLARINLRSQIKEILLGRILNGEYKPGDRLVELQIAQEFGTSQAPVRESLRELEALGFVTSEPYRGTRVREWTRDELSEIYPVRAALEEVAALAAAKYLPGHVAPLEAEITAMQSAAQESNLLEAVRHDVAFHRLIVEASRNRVLLSVWQSLHVESRTLITLLGSNLDLDSLPSLHRPILKALAEGNGPEAGKLVREHIEQFGVLLLKKGNP